MSVACAIISTARRWSLVADLILPAVLAQSFDEVVVGGDGESGDGYRHRQVPDVTGTTIDALMKRDTAAAATDSDVLVYLCDDHRPHPLFLMTLQSKYLHDETWDALAPQRFCMRDGQRCYLNMGQGEKYIGGHGVVVRRNLIREIPWMTAPHSKWWDKMQSYRWASHGAAIRYADNDLLIEDVEKGATPWL